MAVLTLSPPQNRVRVVKFFDDEGKETELRLVLRVFNSADVGWLHGLAGEDWATTIAEAQDVSTAIEVLEHQIENGDELREKFGNEDLLEGLTEHIELQAGVLVSILGMLTELYEVAVNGEVKKKRRKQGLLRRLRTGLICFVSACFGAAMGLYLWTTF